MPILISRASVLKGGKPFPNILSFKEALDAYNKRLLDFNNVAGVHLLDDPRAVSYTHLDVYKRQVHNQQRRAAPS